jgi:FAD:protein FMN transferase
MKSRSSSIRRCRPLLGTLVDISVAAEDTRRLSDALEYGFRAVAKVHALMSFHEPESDVYRLNRNTAGEPVEVDFRTWTVLETGRHISEASDGHFDVTVAARLMDWGFLPRLPAHLRPDPTASWRDVELLDGCRVRFAKPLAIDLGGIAKGFAVDQAIEAIRASGVSSACVNAGGDLRVCGNACEPLYIRYPGVPSELIEAGTLRNEAAATSADADSRRASASGWVSPLVNPRKRHLCNEFASVTVRARTCMLADALAKVVLCGPDPALDILAKFGATALAIDRAGEVRMATCNLNPAMWAA